MHPVDISALAAELPPPLRLAVVYAPRRARALWTALLVLDGRLARAALTASEPLLGQVRLAWWRDRFREPASAWPEGEPLLAALAPLDAERRALEGLVDAWEALIDDEPGAAAVAELGEARAQAVVALARTMGCAAADDAVATARSWALGDLAQITRSDVARDLARRARARSTPLPRDLRPLVVLAGVSNGAGLLRILRLGLFGR